MKSSLKTKIAAALALLGISSLSFGAACAVKSTEVTEPVNSVITKTDPPKDGSLPTAHSGGENLAYIASALASQSQYHCYTYTLTNASITTQITRGYRDFKDGVLISSDITYSSMVKSGTQTCTVFNEEKGEWEVYARSSAEPSSTTTATNADWSLEAPTHYTQNAYYHTYGLLQTELTNFIINDDTILESGEVHANPDGTFTQSFVLDPELSTYYYAYGMKTRGGLSGYPSFQNVTLSVTFTDSWLPLTVTMHDVSSVNKGVVVTSVSDSTCEYSYGDLDGAHFGYYDSYFKAYLGNEDLEQGGDIDEEFVVDLTNVLSNGFANVLSGGEQYEVEITLGKNKYCGYVFVGLDLADPLETLCVKLSLGKSLKSQTLYVEYKNGEASAYYGADFALDVNIATLKPVIGEITQWVKELASTLQSAVETYESVEEGTPDEGESDMLADLLAAMELEVNGGEAILSLNSDDLLGLGVGVDVKLYFGIGERSITFRGGAVNEISLGGEPLDLDIVIRSTTAETISRESTSANASLTDYVADAFSLISSDLISVNLKLEGDSDKVNVSALKGVNADVTALVDIDGVTVGATANVSYSFGADRISALLDIWYDYDVLSGGYGKAVLTLRQLNGAPVFVQVSCDIDELVQAIGTVLTYGGAEQTADSDSIVQMINAALSCDFSSLLTEVYADNLKIKLGVNVDGVLGMLGVDAGVKFGSCTLVYTRGNGVYGGELFAALPAIGFSLSVSGAEGKVQKPDVANCLDLAYLLEDINAFAQAERYEIDIDFDGDCVEQVKGLKANVTAYADIKGLAVYTKINVSYTYGKLPVSAQLQAWYTYDKDTNGTAVLSLDNLNGRETYVTVKCEINKTVEAVKELLAFCKVQLDMPELNVDIQLEEVLTSVISADLSALIPELSTNADGLKLGVNVDEALKLFNVELPVTVGSVNLAYSHTNCNLVANVPAYGLGLTASIFNGEIPQPNTNNALDLVYLLDDINAFAQAERYEIYIDFDGDCVEQVKGLKANVTAYADIKGLAVYTKIDVSYTYGKLPVSAQLQAWYTYDKDTNGTAVLSLDNLNGRETYVTVKCEINKTVEAVKELLAFCKVQLDMPELNVDIKLEEVLTSVISADLSALIPELSTNADGLKLGVNVDEALKLFKVELPVTVGSVNLAYSHSNCNLVANVPAYGLGLTASVFNGEIPQPNTNNALELSDLISLVNSAWEQVNGIIESESVYFDITRGQTYLYLDGITVSLWGEGEISWKAGGEYVALDLGFAIAENGCDETTFKLIYDKNAEAEPLVRLALNGVGLDIYKQDIDTVSQGFASIYEKITSLFGGGAQEASVKDSADSGKGKFDFSSLTANDRLMTLIFGVLSSGDWVDSLNNLTLTFEKQVVTDGAEQTVNRSLTLKYLSDNAVEIRVSANGSLALFYEADFTNGFAFGGEVLASAAQGGLVNNLNAQFDRMDMSSTKKEGSAGFVKLAYDYLFEAFSSVSVKDILGSDTYAVKFSLNGNNCNIAQLEGVFVNAEVYFTGNSNDGGNIAEADLNIDVGGVIFSLNVITERVGSQTYFYIDIRQAANFALPDLKVAATQSSLYETIETLISVVNNTNVLEFIGGFISVGGKDEQAISVNGVEAEPERDTADTVADIVEKILNFRLDDAVIASRADGVTSAVLDLDNVARQLGVQSGSLGTVEIKIDHDRHSMKTSGTALVANAYGDLESKEWISLVSEKTAARDYSKYSKSDYVSIEFLPTLIEDAVKFATDDNGKIHDTFTLSGNIKANLVGMIDVNIDPCTLTVKLGENGISLSLVMHVNTAKVIGIGIPEGTVGITYRNGLLTLAKGLNTATPQAKVMTFDYFLDHLLTKNDSVLNWLFDISGWDLIMSFVNVDLSSNLTSPEDISLFERKEIKDDKEISMYDFVDALRVIIDGKQTAVFGNYSELESDLGVYDNYYGFALNAGLVTGGVLTKLNAAVTRGENGLENVIASGAIQSYVKFSANLKYEENWTEEYVLGTTLTAGKTAPDMYLKALEKAAECNYTPDFDYFVRRPELGYDEIFGCMSVVTANGNYVVNTDYSHVLNSHTLTIITDGETEERFVRHGSTVHLYDNNSPVYTNDSKEYRILYSLSPDGVGSPDVIMNGDLTVYSVVRRAVNVILISGETEYVVTSFAGDFVPLNVWGLDTVEGPFYEDGTRVGANDKIPEDVTTITLYGTFAKSEVIINYVKYTFDGATLTYTASGKAAGFNDYYSVQGNVLVLENEIDGYPVTAIGELAFANTEGKPITSVIVPENVTYIGKDAFKDNVDMQRAVFLADSVYFSGSDTDESFAFYGCSVSDNEEKTQLVIYYNSATCDSGDNKWTHFRTVSVLGIKYYKYIGCDPNTSEWINYHENGGGAIISGSWKIVDYAVEIDLNGVTGSTLTQAAIENILAPYFSVIIAGEVIGSSEELAVRKVLETACMQFNVTRGGVIYTCTFEVEERSSGKTVVLNYKVSYSAACTANIYSPIEFTYYGVQVKANVLTSVIIPVEGDSPVMSSPETSTHDFVGWEVVNENGTKIYVAKWQGKPFNLKIRLTRGNTDTNIVYIDNAPYAMKGALVAGDDVTNITVYGGEATFTLTDKVLTIVTGGVTYTIYVNEASVFGSDKGNKRNIKSDITGTVWVDSDMTLTLSY